MFELAVSQPVLDMPELLWKHYIDLEIGEGKIYSYFPCNYIYIKTFYYVEHDDAIEEIDTSKFNFYHENYVTSIADFMCPNMTR